MVVQRRSGVFSSAAENVWVCVEDQRLRANCQNLHAARIWFLNDSFPLRVEFISVNKMSEKIKLTFSLTAADATVAAEGRESKYSRRTLVNTADAC